MDKAILKEVFENFNINTDIEAYGNGHINDTYRVAGTQYILQKINTDIFKNPDQLMENIENVTSYIKRSIEKDGGDTERGTLTVVKTVDGKNYYQTRNGAYRVYKFISGTKTVEDDKTLQDLFHAGQGFGKFQRILSDYPAHSLYETIKDFHNTPKRVNDLKTAIKEDRVGRAASVKEEIEFALECAEFADVVVSGIEKGEIPLHVTHNDTKINNILFDEETGEAVCVIDLDTVMPGSVLYDFGDALRMGGSTAAEDETDLDKVSFDAEAFKYFAKGFLSETRNSLNEKEISLLPFSVKLLTYECGIRFLTDYLNGDTYFKIHRENHNLDRARNQFKLVRDISEKEDMLRSIVNELI